MEYDFVDLTLRRIYGDDYAKLTPISKALITCMAHGDYALSKTIYDHASDENLAGLYPLHRDLIYLIDKDANSNDLETAWLKELLGAWRAHDIGKGADILLANDASLDTLATSWLLKVKNMTLAL